MAAIRGNNGVLSIGAQIVTSLTSYTLDTTQDTAETSAMGNTGRTYVKTMHGFSGSGDFIFEGPDTAAQQTLITELEFATDTNETAAILLFPDSDGATGVAASTQFNGNVIITGYSITASFDGVVTGSLTFQGTGTLAYTAVA